MLLQRKSSIPLLHHRSAALAHKIQILEQCQLGILMQEKLMEQANGREKSDLHQARKFMKKRERKNSKQRKLGTVRRERQKETEKQREKLAL